MRYAQEPALPEPRVSLRGWINRLRRRAVAAEPRPAGQSTRSPGGAVEPGKPLIMMVDDEPSALEVTQAYLEAAGFTRFIATQRPLEALPMMVEHKPDLLLLDLMMPQMTGFDILTAMEEKRILRDVPTIAITAAVDAETRQRALALWVTEFLTKPVNADELVLRVRSALAAKAYWRGCWGTR